MSSVAILRLAQDIVPRLANRRMYSNLHTVNNMKDFIMKSILSILTLSVLLAGCSSSPAIMSNMDAKIAMDEAKAEVAGETLDAAPDWYIQPPVGDHGLWGAGTAYSNDLQFAIDKARLQAMAGIAEGYKQEVSALRKSYKGESNSGSGQVYGDDQSVIDMLVDKADLSGSVVKDQVVLQERTGFRVYTLTFFPLGETNLIKQLRANEETAGRAAALAQNAHLELQGRIGNK